MKKSVEEWIYDVLVVQRAIIEILVKKEVMSQVAATTLHRVIEIEKPYTVNKEKRKKVKVTSVKNVSRR